MRLPTALNAPEARKEAAEAVSAEKSPVKEVGADVKELLEAAKEGRLHQLPGLSFEAAAPARLSERARSRAAASWQVTGNWVLLLIAGMAMGVLIIGLLEPNRKLEVSGIVWAVVVLWIVCQLMRLVMIMGYGAVKFAFNSSTAGSQGNKVGEENRPEEDKPGEKNGGEERQEPGQVIQGRVRPSRGRVATAGTIKASEKKGPVQ